MYVISFYNWVTISWIFLSIHLLVKLHQMQFYLENKMSSFFEVISWLSTHLIILMKVFFFCYILNFITNKKTEQNITNSLASISECTHLLHIVHVDHSQWLNYNNIIRKNSLIPAKIKISVPLSYSHRVRQMLILPYSLHCSVIRQILWRGGVVWCFCQ